MKTRHPTFDSDDKGFLPSKTIFAKLIKRATQISDVIIEINPTEAKNDPLLKNHAINPKFNNLKVFVPSDLNSYLFIMKTRSKVNPFFRAIMKKAD